jgi:hypothetical protein
MPVELTPHSDEWLAALEKVAPMQAAQTLRILRSAGTDDVCSVCGDEKPKDYRIVSKLPTGAPNTIKLCDDCRRIRSGMLSEKHELM